MHVGFDRSNLDNAAKKLVELAETRSTNCYRPIGGELRCFDLSTEQGAREFLMAAADDVYASSGNGLVARIQDVVYYSLGVVFELTPDEIHPPVLTNGPDKPAHMAFFWHLL